MPYYTEDTARRSTLSLTEIPSTFGEVIEAQFASTVTELPVVAAARAVELYRAGREGARIDQATALARIRDAGLEGHLTIDEAGTTEEALEILIERKRDELRRADILSRAEGGLLQGAARLGVALGTSLLDPVNVGLSFVPIVGQARYARMLALARTPLARAGVRAAVGAAEGAAGAAIAEPIIYSAKQYEQADYDSLDSLLNVAFGTIFGGGLHVIGGAGVDAVRYLRGESKFADDVVLPRSELKAFYEERVRGSEPGEPVANPRFDLGTLPPKTASQVRDLLPDLPEGIDAVRLSGRALKHLEERRPERVPEILDRLDEIVSRPDEVLPNPQRTDRALLVKNDSAAEATVTVLEVARGQDGLEIVSIYEGPQRSLRKARELAEARKLSGLEGQQPVARATDSPHRRLAPEEPHAGADFLRVSPDARTGEPTIPPPDAPVPARDITAEAAPEVREAALRTAVGQMADGRPVNVEPLFSGDPASVRTAQAADPDATRIAEVDEELAQAKETLEAALEEAQLAEQALKEQSARLGDEAADETIAAAQATAKQLDAWARAAELAQTCLLRGE